MPVRNRRNPEDLFVLNWNDQMHDVFNDALEKQHDLGKRSDTGFKPGAWVYCVAEVQNVYTGKGIIPVEKLKNKLDHWKKRWNDWKWVGKQSGIGRDHETGLYIALDTTWEIIFCERPRVKWCRTHDLEYEHQLEKIFGGRAASGEKAASISTLRNNTTTSNDVFDPQLLAQTGNPELEGGTTKDNSYLGRIDKEFGPLSEGEGEDVIEETENSRPTKKAKLHHSPNTLSKEANYSGDETFPQPKITKKKSACFELPNQMREWREHREKEFKQRELAKLSPKVQVMRSIQEHYAEEFEKLSYEEYSRLALLLRKSHEEFGGYTGTENYKMMDGRSTKFRNELITIWFEKIKSQLKAPPSPINEK